MNSKLIYILIPLLFTSIFCKAQENILLVGKEIIRIPQPETTYPEPCLMIGDSIASYDILFNPAGQPRSSYSCEITLRDKTTLLPISIFTNNGTNTSITFYLTSSNSYSMQIPVIRFDRQGRQQVILEFKISQRGTVMGTSIILMRQDLITFCKKKSESLNPEKVSYTGNTDIPISFSPNPTDRFLNIKVSDFRNIRNIRLLTMSGQVVKERNISVDEPFENKKLKIDLTELRQGMYLAIIKLDNGNTSVKIICKE